ncbi:MAG TPA: aldo/keto reductase [Tepidisphaeraceae bacterium]|jgi:predicted aldo/keto reductase-like oxidoreductase
MLEQSEPTRRKFLVSSAALTGAAMLGGVALGADAGAKRTATDQVPLGRTGLKISRLGIGTGSMGGHSQVELGQDNFNKLIRYAFDQGITYIDCAQNYQTFEWIAGAIKDLPREKLFIQSKVPGQPKDILATIDRHRSVFKTDYIDSLLVHCMTKPGWTDEWKRIMEGFDQAKEKKWIRSKGVSCHTLPALQAATKSDWCEVHLVRVNPMGAFMDAASDGWGRRGVPIDPVLAEIKAQHDKGRGIIGMKIAGNGTFTEKADREKSVRFAMNNPNIDCVVIGMKHNHEVDENIAMINAALAAA